MPIYEYVCHACGTEFEAIQKFSEAPLTVCHCGEAGRVERKLSLAAFHLQGGGWYKDRYGHGKGADGKYGQDASSGDGNGSEPGDKSGAKDSAASGGKSETAASGAGSAGTGNGGSQSSSNSQGSGGTAPAR